MEDADFSDEFCRFVQQHLPSVAAAELLLQAYRDPLAAPEDARKLVEAQQNHVATLAQAYEQRPVTLIRLIYALRDNKIRSFADAFKLRKS